MAIAIKETGLIINHKDREFIKNINLKENTLVNGIMVLSTEKALNIIKISHFTKVTFFKD
jgi:hypothetical protein